MNNKYFLLIISLGFLSIGMHNVVTAATTTRTTREENPEANVMLLMACKRDDVKTVKLAIKDNADVNFIDSRGNTPLIWACHRNNLAIVELLLKNDADANIANWYGQTPLFWAFKNKNIAMAQLLLNHGADDATQTPLIDSCTRGNADIVNALLKSGANVNTVDKGSTSLMPGHPLNGEGNKSELDAIVDAINKDWKSYR